ncbi:MAG: hypothetical protein ACO3LE_08320, partial [Bdellovibrionota bacterium]
MKSFVKIFIPSLLLILAFNLSFALRAQDFVGDSCEQSLRVLSWRANPDSLEGRLKIILSLLNRHPNITSLNKKFKRNLENLFSPVSKIQKLLGDEAADFETNATNVRFLRYVATERLRYNEGLVQTFISDRLK